MTLKITKDDLDFVTSSIVLVVMTPFLIWFGIAANWDDFFGWLIGEIFFYTITLFSDVLHDWI
jgi:hypothetical protein